MRFNCAVEGLVDEAVVRRLLSSTGHEVGPVFGRAGKARVRERIAADNFAARQAPWLVLVDLNTEEECAPTLRRAWLPEQADSMVFRVAVHEVESWLFADRARFANFLAIPVSRVPTDADGVTRPKELVVNLARHSRRRDIRNGLVPGPDSGRMIGPLYTASLIQFVAGHWDPQRAGDNSESLGKALARISAM